MRPTLNSLESATYMNHTHRSILAVAVATAVATLAACGGGGGSDPAPAAPAAPSTPSAVLPPQIVATLPTNTTVTTGAAATVKFASPKLATVKGATGWKLYPIASAADGTLLSGKVYTWTSSNPAIATVAADGAITSLATGSTTVTATVDGKSATIVLEVKDSPTTLAQLKDLLPFSKTSGTYRVSSDYGDALSDQHLANLLDAWAYFKRIYPTSVGDHTEIFITQEAKLITDIASKLPECNQSVVSAQPSRVVLSCYDPVTGNNNWFVAPQTLPDFAIAQGEESQAFLLRAMSATSTLAKVPVEDWPWVMEGIAYGHESGTIGAGGASFSVAKPTPYLLSEYKKRAAANALKPLADLVALTSAQFTDVKDWGNHAQTAMLFVYIEKTRAGTIEELITALNGRTITSSAQVLTFLTTKLSTDATALDAAYKAFAATL